MAVPFINEDDESEEQIQRLHQLFAEFVQVLTQILEQLQQAPPPMPAQYSKCSSQWHLDPHGACTEPASPSPLSTSIRQALLAYQYHIRQIERLRGHFHIADFDLGGLTFSVEYTPRFVASYVLAFFFLAFFVRNALNCERK